MELALQLIPAVTALVAVTLGPIMIYRSNKQQNRATLFVARRQIKATMKNAERQIQATAHVAERQIQATVVSANRQAWIHQLREYLVDYVTNAKKCMIFDQAAPGQQLAEGSATWQAVLGRLSPAVPAIGPATSMPRWEAVF